MGSTFWKAQNKLSSAKDLGSSLRWPEVSGSLEGRQLLISHMGQALQAPALCAGANQHAPQADLNVPLPHRGTVMAPSSPHTSASPPSRPCSLICAMLRAPD